MYCRNCGKELVGTPDICMSCGARPLSATAYCPACGATTNAMAVICVKCGAGLEAKSTTVASNVSKKSRLVLVLLAWFLGTLGVHRFYAGKIGTGVTMLILTIIGWATIFIYLIGLIFIIAVGIWSFVDFIIAIVGHFKDKEGKVIANWAD
jgi:TM2 domain-containing membrane protein YozV